jgi:hypothetical protein
VVGADSPLEQEKALPRPSPPRLSRTSASLKATHRLDPHVKYLTFTVCAIAGLGFSGLAVLLLLANLISGNQFVDVILPTAVVSLVVGGAFSVRARLLSAKGHGPAKR